ncbi:MAG: ATP-binding protein [Deltaproteobacteria bacterium]|nr:ATP-binding protein [Deltaproteobacteria bacterium]MBI3391492.1 ATP-binding protein [Deltaproteobacteria bacterium]
MATLFPRLLEVPKQSFFLFGPRGTGKSTWVRTQLPTAHRIDLLDEALYHAYLVRPGQFADELRALRPGTTVCVDEIQRLPQLLNEVHRFIEERRLRFVLCGSSARKLKQHGTNLLAGRAARRELHPLVPAELGHAFALETVLTTGSLPIIWQAPERREALQAYVRMYLKEEVQAEALVRSLPGFARFLPIAALFHGQTLNTATLARDAGVARTTVTGYLEILEDTLLAFRLPAYAARMRVREKRHPKWYWVDAGIVRALKNQFAPPAAEERGALFEGWVAGVLRSHRDYHGLFEEWYYWAPAEAARTEVDFLLARGREWLAIEAKVATTIDDDALRGLRAVEGLKGLARRILVHPGGRRARTRDGIDVLPVGDFLDAVANGSLWP